ncbi:MAG TPA: beta-ketoacyl-[acyl-carrier-protein] synthase family protein [Planctomycetaceae bacterium]|nr:beta-ketoacyl-[acyl-carrier-protein] synthase family protein [Planctomycetaceae bacterium]
MESPREVVITGVGVISPLGIGKAPLWQGLTEGRSGVRSLKWLAETGTPIHLGAEITDFNPKEYVRPRKALKVMSVEIQHGYAAAVLAREDAGLDPATLDPNRLGVVFGADMLYCHPEELSPVYRRCVEDGKFDFSRFGPAAMKELFPLWMLLYLPNMVACHIGISVDGRGPTNTITLGEVSGMLSVMEAADVIRRGHADVMIAGGVGNRLSPTPMVYRGEWHLSRRNDDPARAVRPFDADRDGTVRGQGAAAFILESREHARRRGAHIVARIAGSSSRFGRAPESVATSTRAIQQSIVGTLEASGVHVSDVGGVIAHGMATREHDPLEAAAIHSVLEDVPVTAPKSFYGNSGAACSAIDLAVAVMALGEGQLPVTLNYETPDPACPVKVVHDEPAPLTSPRLLTLSQSTSGQAAAMLLEADEG